MSRNYSTHDFFQKMPNALLARYFAGRATLKYFDFAAMKETRIDVLFDAWMVLSEPTQMRMGSVLANVR